MENKEIAINCLGYVYVDNFNRFKKELQRLRGTKEYEAVKHMLGVASIEHGSLKCLKIVLEDGLEMDRVVFGKTVAFYIDEASKDVKSLISKRLEKNIHGI